jgi:DNA-binding transcriptional ArsR family regulator
MEFFATDLGRVRVASGPHPMWELILAINSLQSPNLPAGYQAWRADVRRTLGERRQLLAAATALVPASGNFPDFFTPPIGDRDVEAHLESILSVPRNRLREDLSRTFRHWPKVPRWAQCLHRHGRLEGVAGVLRDAHAVLVGPVDQGGFLSVEGDRGRYARLLLEGGTEHLLANLHPSIRWRSPVLEASYPVDRTIGLAGRGLVLTPAHFCWGAPVTFIDAGQPPTLVVPAGDSPRAPAVASPAVESLGKLLGPTRARLLDALSLSTANSTSGLAARLAVTPAAISQHTKVLREARLISTTRSGLGVRHHLTPLGRELLRK